MAQSPEKVAQFLSSLAKKLQPLWHNEQKELLKLKEEEVAFKKVNFFANLILKSDSA